MKPKRVLLFTTTLVLILCGACGVWLHKERQQYAHNRALIDALTHKDANAALALVNAGADPNERYDPPPAPTFQFLLDTLLHHTRPPANDSPTAFMLACGAPWIHQDRGRETSFFVEENLPLLRAMLAHGANINVNSFDKFTALHNAVLEERLRTVELLIKGGADVNAADPGGQTPLMCAARNAAPDITRLLLEHRANPNA